jgi:hypothetical protein
VFGDILEIKLEYIAIILIWIHIFEIVLLGFRLDH